MALVAGVANRLPDEMRSERPAAEAVAFEQLPLGFNVAVLAERAVDLEVVAPAGELEPVEAPPRAAGREVKRVTGRAIRSPP